MRRLGFVVIVSAVVTMTVAGAAPASRTGAATTVDVPATIDATGRTDVTVALSAFLATVAPGVTVRFPRNGTLLAENVVVVDGLRDVTIDGRGARIVARTDGSGQTPRRPQLRRQWPRSREHLHIERSVGITVRNLTIEGPNARGAYRIPLEAQAGVLVAKSQNVELDGITIRATYGDGVYVTGKSSNVRVHDCTLDHIGRQGVTVVAGEHVVVEHCSIDHVARSAIDLEPGHGFALDVRIRDNTVSGVTNFLLAAVGAGPRVGDVWLERNHVRGGKGVSVYAGVSHSLRSGLHVLDNVGSGTSHGYQGALMHISRFDGVEVRGNRQTVAAGVTPVQLVDSCHETVTGNDFGSASPALGKQGDCSSPGVRSPRRGTSATTTPVGGGSDAAQGRRRAGTTTTTAAPRVVVRRVTRGGTSPVTVALAFGAGALAGGGAILLWSWSRRERSGSA